MVDTMGTLELIEGWPVDRVGAAAVWPDGAIEAAGAADSVFELASLTKLLVAVAVMVAVEDETLDLDEAAGPAGSTVRHLLAHASGLSPDSDRLLAEPGTRRIYSNTGYRLLGRLLEERSGLPLPTYVGEAVLDPLGMDHTTMGPTGESGATGTVTDLARFATDLIAPDPTLIAPATRDLATAVAFPGLSGVLPGFGSQDTNDWGLGFERRDSKWPHWSPDAASPATFGHFGSAGSLLWIDPTRPAALAVLGDRPFGDWAPPLWRELGAAVLDAADRRVRPGESAPIRQPGDASADGSSAVVDSGVTR